MRLKGLSRVGLAGIGVVVFVMLGAVFVVVALSTSWLLAPHNPSPEKSETYECGAIPIGPVWVQFRPGYYVFALLYVIFDIETVFLYPFALTFGFSGWFVFVEMLVFIAILVIGYAYAWKEGALTWR